MRIAIAPYRRTPAIEALEERATLLGVNVSTRTRSGLTWDVRVWRTDPQTFVVSSVELRGEGSPAAVIAGALLDFAEKFPDERYTPEELIVIAHQSGIV